MHRRGNSLDFRLVGSGVLLITVYKMALRIVNLNPVVLGILYGAHTENLLCNGVRSRTLAIAPHKKTLKLTKLPSRRLQRVPHLPAIF